MVSNYRKPTELECLYVDFDAFFANVEKQLEVGIRQSPVGITSLGSESASLITCCYMAKRAGVKRGMRVSEAREICPDLVTRTARHDVYVDTHKAILREIDKHLPISRVMSIDEVACSLMGRERHKARLIAQNIRDGLAQTIGPYVTPSIGISANQFLAKVAAEINKPNGLTILHPDQLPGLLLDLDLQDLPGISKNMQRRLNKAGIESVKQFWNISAKHARAIWHSVEGERLWAQLHGYCVERPDTKRAMFGHGRRLSGIWQKPNKAYECLHLLTTKAAYRMRREGFTAGALSITLTDTAGHSRRQDSHFAACADDYRLTKHMKTLYDEVNFRLPAQTRFEQVSVMLHDIIKTGQRSGDLFDEAPDNPKWLQATQSMDKLNEKHGKCVVHLGPRAQLPGGYAGAKIAFGRIPDEKDFY